MASSVSAGGEGDGAAVPEQEPEHGGAEDRRELRVGGERLRQRHLPDHDDAAHGGAAAAAVRRVQGPPRRRRRPRPGALPPLLGHQRRHPALHRLRRHDGAGVRRLHGGAGGHRRPRARRPRARLLVVVGAPPVRCVPAQRIIAGGVRRQCATPRNQVALLYNRKLGQEIGRLNAKLAGVKIVLVDLYNILADVMHRYQALGTTNDP